ncbi:lantibiotic biosynthesis dehydratase-like protein [Streptomyces sp. T12]|nr:lantibiotic dehydratase family protein [Streptomyces sp. T12]TWD11728.1 lantibiotic biosynthesis dehydratase-like protein [Streptomyces sp. T12]
MTRSIYRQHGDVLVLRAAALPVGARPDGWPDAESPEDCRRWLARVWADDSFTEALRAASSGLVTFVEQILHDHSVTPKRVRSATLSVAGYLLRATSRPTPFGLFAGVALADVGPVTADVGKEHQAVARPDTLWVDHVRRVLERRADVLPHLTIQVSTLAFQRGDAIVLSRSGGRLASAPLTRPLVALLKAAAAPTTGRRLLDVLADMGGTAEQATRLIKQALDDGYLTSDLVAPMTVADPAGHMVRLLRPYADTLDADTVRILDGLEEIELGLAAHNRAPGPAEARRLRDQTDSAMEKLQAGDCRNRISLDLRLDARVSVPRQVLDEVERAASALVRLTRAQGESPAWADFQAQFWERYGVGVLVPVRDAADLAAGAGLPADYPMSGWSLPPLTVLPRDELLAARAMQAAVTGAREIVLTERDIDDLAKDAPDGPTVPHVKIGFRVRAASEQAVSSGDFVVDVRPAWTAGVLSGRFTAVLGTALSDLYRTLPTMTEGALHAQLSVMPDFPHAQNVSRIPALLPYVIPVGETRTPADCLIDIDDLAVYSTGRALHLVSMSRRRIVEPHVLHPLALEKQVSPLARFLAQLGRGFATAWTEFDWGPAAAALPYLPRVRYRRTVLSPARWRLAAADLPAGPFNPAWHKALKQWAGTWRCPARVQLQDDDRTMPLDLAEPLHARLIHQHLRRRPQAVLTEDVSDEDLGWLGHAHELTLPLATTRSPAPAPGPDARPRRDQPGHGPARRSRPAVDAGEGVHPPHRHGPDHHRPAAPAARRPRHRSGVVRAVPVPAGDRPPPHPRPHRHPGRPGCHAAGSVRMDAPAHRGWTRIPAHPRRLPARGRPLRHRSSHGRGRGRVRRRQPRHPLRPYRPARPGAGNAVRPEHDRYRGGIPRHTRRPHLDGAHPRAWHRSPRHHPADHRPGRHRPAPPQRHITPR